MNNKSLPEKPESVELPSERVATIGATVESDDKTVAPLPAVERIAALFIRGKHGYAALPTAVSASLRRLDLNRPARSMDSVIGTLVAAGLPVNAMDDDEIIRWAAVVHAVALLSGTSGPGAHRSSRSAGKAIADAGYSSTRFARLLTAQGSALPAQISRLTRFLANAPRAIPLDLRPIAELLLWDGRNVERADAARMTLARGYYASVAAPVTAD